MYIIKNAIRNIRRMRGRNLVIGIIITCITMSACIAIIVKQSGSELITSYKESNPVEVSFSLMRSKFENDPNNSEAANTSVEKLSVEDVKKYADSNYVTGYYYTLEKALSSNDISPVETETSENEDSERSSDRKKFDMGSMGDFRLTAYSDASYITDFIEGTKKMTTGSMFTLDDTENSIIISESLATENDLEVGDEVVFYDPQDEEKTYTFKITGFYENNQDENENGFLKMNVMNSDNQIYTTIQALTNILDDTEENLGPDQGLTAKFYLKKMTDVSAFAEEIYKKGLDESYQIQTNEQELLETLTPIEQISKFSGVFLIVILIVGALILSVINLLHIRERKYEIGVLRSIGMSKWKVCAQIICEIFIVAIISLVIGSRIGSLLSEPVANFILKEQIESNEQKSATLQENFGSRDFGGGPGMGQGKMNRGQDFKGSTRDVDYVDTLTIKMDAMTYIKLTGFSLALVLISSFLSILNINKYEPNKILQSRN